MSVQGVTWQLTGGVVKNIIPAIASTNAIIAAACALETLKLITMCSTGINNYIMCACTTLAPHQKTLLLFTGFLVLMPSYIWTVNV